MNKTKPVKKMIRRKKPVDKSKWYCEIREMPYPIECNFKTKLGHEPCASCTKQLGYEKWRDNGYSNWREIQREKDESTDM